MFQFRLKVLKKRANETLQLQGLPARLAQNKCGHAVNEHCKKTNGHQRSNLAVGLFISNFLQLGGDQTGQLRLAACFYGFTQIFFCFGRTWYLDAVAKHPFIA